MERPVGLRDHEKIGANSRAFLKIKLSMATANGFQFGRKPLIKAKAGGSWFREPFEGHLLFKFFDYQISGCSGIESSVRVDLSGSCWWFKMSRWWLSRWGGSGVSSTPLSSWKLTGVETARVWLYCHFLSSACKILTFLRNGILVTSFRWICLWHKLERKMFEIEVELKM
jgi:hypothetical protein